VNILVPQLRLGDTVGLMAVPWPKKLKSFSYVKCTSDDFSCGRIVCERGSGVNTCTIRSKTTNIVSAVEAARAGP
jgi:hypothetical protein